MSSWIQDRPDGVALFCKIQPRASQTNIVGLYGDPPLLKIRIAALPQDGAANEALIAFLSQYFKITKNKIQILSGTSHTHKTIHISGVTSTELIKLLNPHLKKR